MSKGAHKKKNDVGGDMFAILFPEKRQVYLPGKESVYLYSANYQLVDKLISKTGNSLDISLAEFEDDREKLWSTLKDNGAIVGTNVAFCGKFASKKKLYVQGIKSLKSRKNHNQMKLRRTKKYLDQETSAF